MQAKQFKGMDMTLTTAADWPAEEMGEIKPIPVKFEGGYAISAWKPSREEFKTLIDGGWVYICVAVHEKRTMPPIMVVASEAMPVGEIP
jgi:hypothetical protein